MIGVLPEQPRILHDILRSGILPSCHRCLRALQGFYQKPGAGTSGTGLRRLRFSMFQALIAPTV